MVTASQSRPAAVRRPPLRAHARPASLPLSYAQQRLWFIDQLEGGGSSGYILSDALKLDGPLDMDAFARAVNAIAARHEILRTRFVAVNGVPAQIIEPAMRVDLQYDDLSAQDRAAREALVDAALHREITTPFDVQRGPLWRLRFLRMGPEEHVLVRTIHHLIADGWSAGVLNRELLALYAEFHDGRQDPLPPLPVQYADFTLWQRSWLEDGALAAGLDYWREQLADLPERLTIPTDRARLAYQTFDADVISVDISDVAVSRLKQVARAERATLYMTLVAGLAVVLARCSGQDDIVIGSPVANRDEPELAELIGCLVNSVALRVGVRPDLSFAALLRQVRTTVLGALRHHNVPFDRVVEALAIPRSLNVPPVFQVSFSLQNAPWQPPSLAGLTVSPLPTPTHVRYDFEIHAWERGGGVRMMWLYNRQLFDRSRVERMTRLYNRLIDCVAQEPEQVLGRVRLVDVADVVARGPARTEEHLGPPVVHRLFEACAAANPSRTALVSGATRVTFAELDSAADAIADLLMKHDVGTDRTVGIYARRGVPLVAGILGILKTGGAYVPLDPEWPAERIAAVVVDSRSALVLAEADLVPHMPPIAGVTMLTLPQNNGGNGDPARRHAGIDIPRHAAAYVLYTSGSTGRPKGVVVEHDQIANYVAGVSRRVDWPAQASFALLTSPSYDFSLTMLFSALCSGGCLHIVSGDMALDSDRLGRYFQRERIDCVKMTPSHFRALYSTPGGTSILPAGRLILGGEAGRYGWLQGVGQAVPQCRVFNHYGPTETTVGAMMHEVEPDPPRHADDRVIPLGEALGNVRAYILDDHLQPVAPGTIGELYIGGRGVARGYIGQPAATAARFVADPFSGAAVRMYRTGDRVYRHPDGYVEFIGRGDHQTKIRGFRIELGEIEAALMRDQRVDAAIATIAESGDERLLAAYVTLREHPPDDSTTTHVEYWQDVHDSTYAAASPSGDEPSLAGWTDSYTGAPLAESDMRIWIDETVRSLLDVHPSRVLEIGCGSGLILSRLAPHCTHYIGLDFAPHALTLLQRLIDRRPDLRHVELRHGAAHDLSAVAERSVDLVVLNSVVQYFPDVTYLLDVLRQAIRVTRDGGHVFIGDVRNLHLLEAYHVTVHLTRAAEHTSAAAARAAVRLALRQERELVVAPELFESIGRTWPRVAKADVSLKAGAYANELNRFRFDALVRVGEKERVADPDRAIGWDPAGVWRDEVERAVSRSSASICVRGIPDKRVAGAVDAARVIHSDDPAAVSRARVAWRGDARGQDPDEIWQTARRLGCGVHWTGGTAAGVYDVTFNPRTEPGHASSGGDEGAYASYANHPARHEQDIRLGRELRDALRRVLPEYMIPVAVTVLDEWPLSRNGKVDRSALAQFDAGRRGGAREAPRTPDEERLCGIFAEVLGLLRVGVRDSFFELGGDSIMSIQLVSRARTAGFSFTPQHVFEHQTVERLAALSVVSGADTMDDPVGIVRPTPIICRLKERSGPFSSYSQWMCMDVPPLDSRQLADMLQWLVNRHDVLRGRLILDGAAWHLEIAPSGSVDASGCITRREMAIVASHVWPDIVAREAATAASHLDPRAGVLMQAVWFDGGQRDGKLLLVIHHLAVDGVSWRIVSDDCRAYWDAMTSGRASPVPPTGTSFRRWSDLLYASASDDARRHELAHWTSIPAPANGSPERRLDPRRDTWGRAVRTTMELPVDLAAPLLSTAPAAFHGTVNDVLLAAFALALVAWRRRQGRRESQSVVFDLEGHGRESVADNIDLSRTVGWFSNVYPVKLNLEGISIADAIAGHRATAQAVNAVKEQLRAVPANGLGFGLLRYLNPATAPTIAALPVPDVIFNYLGRFGASDGHWKPSQDVPGIGAFIDDDLPLTHSLAVHAIALERDGGPELRTTWIWAPGAFTDAVSRDLMELWRSAITGLLRFVETHGAAERTPSDVPLLSLTRAELAQLEKRAASSPARWTFRT